MQASFNCKEISSFKALRHILNMVNKLAQY